MALGTLTIVEKSAMEGPVFYDRITVVGDGAYVAGGSTDFEAKFKAAIKAERTIIGIVDDQMNGAVGLKFDHTTRALVTQDLSDGSEDTTANQSGTTYGLTVISK